MFMRVFVNERRASYCKPFGARWQGYWTNNMCATSFGCLNDTFGGLIKYAMIIVASVPVMLLYPLVQRHYVRGVMIGAIKG